LRHAVIQPGHFDGLAGAHKDLNLDSTKGPLFIGFILTETWVGSDEFHVRVSAQASA
jgi:hypothetical protein